MIDVSIIVPVYDVEKYIRRCLESVISQECDSIQIECVIVDDCSPDESMDIVEQMLINYHGGITFRIERHECNRGLSAARNTGIMTAKGENILFLDSDDQLAPHAVECLVDAKRSNPKVDIVMGNVLDCQLRKMFASNRQTMALLEGRKQLCRGFFDNTIIVTAWNKLVSRQLLIDNNLFFIEGVLFEDVPWTFDLILHVDSLLILPSFTYIYEYNETSIMNTRIEKSDKTAYSYAAISLYLTEHSTSNVYEEYRQLSIACILNAMDICNKYDISEDTLLYVNNVKRLMIRSALMNGKFLICLYSYLILDLFHGIFRFRFFRRYFDKINGFAFRFLKLMNNLTQHIFSCP